MLPTCAPETEPRSATTTMPSIDRSIDRSNGRHERNPSDSLPPLAWNSPVYGAGVICCASSVRRSIDHQQRACTSRDYVQIDGTRGKDERQEGRQAGKAGRQGRRTQKRARLLCSQLFSSLYLHCRSLFPVLSHLKSHRSGDVRISLLVLGAEA